jgi:hypothetical protein
MILSATSVLLCYLISDLQTKSSFGEGANYNSYNLIFACNLFRLCPNPDKVTFLPRPLRQIRQDTGVPYQGRFAIKVASPDPAGCRCSVSGLLCYQGCFARSGRMPVFRIKAALLSRPPHYRGGCCIHNVPGKIIIFFL